MEYYRIVIGDESVIIASNADGEKVADVCELVEKVSDNVDAIKSITGILESLGYKCEVIELSDTFYFH